MRLKELYPGLKVAVGNDKATVVDINFPDKSGIKKVLIAIEDKLGTVRPRTVLAKAIDSSWEDYAKKKNSKHEINFWNQFEANKSARLGRMRKRLEGLDISALTVHDSMEANLSVRVSFPVFEKLLLLAERGCKG